MTPETTVVYWPEYNNGQPWGWSRYFEGYPTRERAEQFLASATKHYQWRIAKVTMTVEYIDPAKEEGGPR